MPLSGKHDPLSLARQLIRLIGVLVPRRLRADWRQEWEAELRYREALLARVGSAYSAGCNPKVTQSERRLTIRSLFIFRASTVARPVAVSPTMRVPPAFH